MILKTFLIAYLNSIIKKYCFIGKAMKQYLQSIKSRREATSALKIIT